LGFNLRGGKDIPLARRRVS